MPLGGGGQVRLENNKCFFGERLIKGKQTLGKMAVGNITIRETDLVGETTLGKPSWAKCLLFDRS